jgi:transcriptional regulator with PAS, ATPase and Fis domain
MIEGETGTGKELLARAIHQSSTRRDQPFQVVNCGAIPEDLIDSELFGYEKGAFTGAVGARAGLFEAADTGTIFLDEIGELPLHGQVRLLRVLQEQEVTRVGATKPHKIDVRVISATNRDLIEEVAAGRFRQDLYYRLAVVTLRLPPLREREGDLNLLIDNLLEKVNEEADKQPGLKRKELSAGARNVLCQHPWPGNVRELFNTLQRAALWLADKRIEESDAREALQRAPGRGQDGVLEQPLGGAFDIEELLGSVEKKYIEKALAEAGGNKTRAAELLGVSNYQTLSNRMKKYGIEG